MTPTASTDMSPRAKARLGGALFLATIVAGVTAQEALGGRLIVTGDAAATARNIVAHPSLLRAAFAVYMTEMACQIAMVAVFYDLLRPVDRSVARTAAVFGFVGCGIKALSRLFLYAPLLVLGRAPYLAAFDAPQRDAIAHVMIRVNEQGAAMALVFFGVNTLMTGYLMLRATFFPRVLGVLGLIGGVGWLAFVYPPLGFRFNLPITLVALVGSAATIGWLLVRGVDEAKWYQTAASSSKSVWR